MVKINETLNYKDKNYKRVSYRTLLKVIKERKKALEVYFIPCKANLDCPWIELIYSPVKRIVDLDKCINKIEESNCNSEVGNRLHYYILAE